MKKWILFAALIAGCTSCGKHEEVEIDCDLKTVTGISFCSWSHEAGCVACNAYFNDGTSAEMCRPHMRRTYTVCKEVKR